MLQANDERLTRGEIRMNKIGIFLIGLMAFFLSSTSYAVRRPVLWTSVEMLAPSAGSTSLANDGTYIYSADPSRGVLRVFNKLGALVGSLNTGIVSFRLGAALYAFQIGGVHYLGAWTPGRATSGINIYRIDENIPSNGQVTLILFRALLPPNVSPPSGMQAGQLGMSSQIQVGGSEISGSGQDSGPQSLACNGTCFGRYITALSNGIIAVSAEYQYQGAIHLINLATGTLVKTIWGNSANPNGQFSAALSTKSFFLNGRELLVAGSPGASTFSVIDVTVPSNAFVIFEANTSPYSELGRSISETCIPVSLTECSLAVGAADLIVFYRVIANTEGLYVSMREVISASGLANDNILTSTKAIYLHSVRSLFMIPNTSGELALYDASTYGLVGNLNLPGVSALTQIAINDLQPGYLDLIAIKSDAASGYIRAVAVSLGTPLRAMNSQVTNSSIQPFSISEEAMIRFTSGYGEQADLSVDNSSGIFAFAGASIGDGPGLPFLLPGNVNVSDADLITLNVLGGYANVQGGFTHFFNIPYSPNLEGLPLKMLWYAITATNNVVALFEYRFVIDAPGN